MSSNVVKINPEAIDEKIINKAIDLLANNEIIAFPTDTVYGLGGSIFSQEAVKKIYAVKNRPLNKPINALISNFEQLEMIVKDIPEIYYKLMKNFWPGPLTLVFMKNNEISNTITGGLDTIGVRMPNHKIALKIIENFGKPLATTSANISNQKSSLTAEGVFTSFANEIPMILEDNENVLGTESTIVAIIDHFPQILRKGVITKEQLSEYLPK